jgi:hypothetical protein
MKSVLALDLAKSTGWAFGSPGGKPLSGVQKLGRPDSSRGTAFFNLRTWLNEQISVLQPDYICFEAPLVQIAGDRGNKADVPRMLIGLAAIVEEVAYSRKLFGNRVFDGHAQTCRKHFIGSGNLKGTVAKPLVARKCLDLGWVDKGGAKQFDRCDALCVWSWAAHKIDPDAFNSMTPLFSGVAAE